MIRGRVGVSLACGALLVGLASCAASQHPATTPSSRLDKTALDVCTATGSTPLPRTGDERVVGAEDSNVEAVGRIVAAEYRKDFDRLVSGHGSGAYLALCFDQIKPSGVPANGRVIIAQLKDAGGSTFIGTW